MIEALFGNVYVPALLIGGALVLIFIGRLVLAAMRD